MIVGDGRASDDEITHRYVLVLVHSGQYSDYHSPQRIPSTIHAITTISRLPPSQVSVRAKFIPLVQALIIGGIFFSPIPSNHIALPPNELRCTVFRKLF